MLAHFLRYLFFFAEGSSPSARTVSHSVTTRSLQSVQVLGRVTVQFVFRCFGFVISFFWHMFVQPILGWARDSAVQRVEFFRKLSCWFSLCLQDFFCLVQEYVSAALCFSISSCRDDVARVAGLALQGRCKVVVRVCVWFRCGVVSCRVLFHHCRCFLRGDASLRIGSWFELQSSMRQCGGRQCRSGVTTFPLAPRHACVCWVASSHVVWPETRLTVM